MIAKARQIDPTIKLVDAREAMFRINRDSRFGGPPYQAHMVNVTFRYGLDKTVLNL